ncbi:alpha/beta hydrolase [Betaproteobacteria bacterium GR16-43]|nr:alpha/beta hydrolase [Betaproteobacteria bacterium GR16-43]
METEVSLATATGTLHGTELRPDSAGKVPVVLIHAGSGPTDRDGNSRLFPGSNNSLKLLAEGLAARGIASVRYDKRAIGKSAAAAKSEADLRFEDYVDDAAGWITRLKSDPRFSSVTVAGHSEGSLIGMVAAKKARADGFVSLAGIARSADLVLSDQLRTRLPPDLFQESERVLRSLKAGNPVPDVPASLATVYRPSVQPYLISWIKYSPANELKAIGMPVLIVQGTNDIQVDVAEARALAAAQPAAKLVLIEGMNHVLKKVTATDQAGQLASYGDPKLPVPEELLDVIATFVKR